MSANGLSSRCLRARSAATAIGVARVAREVVATETLDGEDRAIGEPPRGDAQRILVAGEVAPIARREQRHPSDRTPGTHSAGRESAGRPGPHTPRRHASHIAKPAIVVSGRSYGTPRTIVNRGPQFVQFVNG